MTGEKVMGLSNGPMVDSMRAAGRMAISMERVCLRGEMECRGEGRGMMENMLGGLIKTIVVKATTVTVRSDA